MRSLAAALAAFCVVASSLACALVGDRVAQDRVDEIADDESPSPESFSLVVVRPAHGDLTALLAAHAALAAELDRLPFVEFSAEWCPSCVLLERSLTDERMIDAFRGVYLIRLDIDEWKNHMSGTGFAVFGVPAFYEIDGDGRPTGRSITGAAWGPDIPENMAPVLKAFFEDAETP
jgi:thiol:disulfide interchange protein